MYFGGIQAARRVTRSVRDPPRCASQLHGVPDQPREAVLESECSLLLESVAVYILGPFRTDRSGHLFSRMIVQKGYQNVRNVRYVKRRRNDAKRRQPT